MEAVRVVIAGIAFSAAAAGAAGDVLFVRPEPCAARETYLLAANSGAIIRVGDEPKTGAETRVIVYRRPERTGLMHEGWASRRLLKRFDLSLGGGEPAVVNSGAFCRGPQ